MVKAFILPFFQKAKIQSETTWFQLGISVDGMKILTSMNTVHTKQVSIVQNPSENTKLNTQCCTNFNLQKSQSRITSACSPSFDKHCIKPGIIYIQQQIRFALASLQTNSGGRREELSVTPLRPPTIVGT
jgi:hypothetical protein